MTFLISACLLGEPCRYNGEAKANPAVLEFVQNSGHTFITVCPEVLGGLPIPRAPAERLGSRVKNREGEDVTKAFLLGAEKTLALAQQHRCDGAILKERSPSCGHGQIYDGTFSGRLIPGDGITSQLLRAHCIPVYGESRLPYVDIK